jgi:catechol 2,3-dioxygenase
MTEHRLTGPRPQLRHMGLFVTDLDAVADFYVRVLGMSVTDRGVSSLGIPLAFLSSDPAQHHQLVLAVGRERGAPGNVNQVAFQVESLGQLLDYGRFLSDCGITPGRVLDHGNAWSIYFADPEGNKIEVYCDTEWHHPQPCGIPIDLDSSEEAIRAATATMVAENPAAGPVEQWRSQFADLAAADRERPT